MIGPEYFLHASNITRVFSFSAKDVLWLRVFAILASLIGLPYFYLQTTVLWEPIVWAVLFMSINTYHVWRLWMERRPVVLSSDEARLYDLTFFPLSALQFVELARLRHMRKRAEPSALSLWPPFQKREEPSLAATG